MISGRSTSEAIELLVQELEGCIVSESIFHSRNICIVQLFNYVHQHRRNNGSQPFCLYYLLVEVLLFLVATITMVLSYSVDRYRSYTNSSVLLVVVIILILIILNIALSSYIAYLYDSETNRKVKHLIGHVKSFRSYCGGWYSSFYPDLYLPTSECIALQWTKRDGKLINLPVMLLVVGDVICLRPGHVAPCRVRKLQVDDSIVLERGQVFDRGSNDSVKFELSTTIKFVSPIEPGLFEVLQSPAASYLKSCLSEHSSNRPSSVFANELFRTIHIIIERYLIPSSLLWSLVISAIRLTVFPEISADWFYMIFVVPSLAILPLSGLVLPLFIFIINCVSLAFVFGDFASRKELDKKRKHSINRKFGIPTTAVNMHVFTSEHQTGNNSSQESLSIDETVYQAPPKDHWSVLRQFWKIISGDPEHLPMTANLVHCFSNLTSLAVVDKKGLLSWPNPTPEKIMFFSKQRGPTNNALLPPPSSALARVVTDSQLIPVVRHKKSQSRSTKSQKSVDNDTGVESSDDGSVLSVQSFNLAPTEPVGSSVHHQIVPRTLDLTHDPDQAFLVHFDDPRWETELSSLKPIGLNVLLNSCHHQEIYTSFADHLSVLSRHVPRTRMVHNRRCLCWLASEMGFDRKGARMCFEEVGYMCAYKKLPGQVQLPGAIRHYTPFANLLSVEVVDHASKHLQVFSQGTAEIIGEQCSMVWDGEKVTKFAKHQRKRLADFYHRASMTSYCLALSYSPAFRSIPRHLKNGYVQLPNVSEKRIGTRKHQQCQFRQRLGSKFEHQLLSMANRSVSHDSIFSFDSSTSINSIATHRSTSETDCSKGEQVDQLIGNQIFIGLVSMQYQAKPDVVRMVDQLDKACIRFVHFSKENEIRSRVFAEKLGLETGWNCHISLASPESCSTVSAVHTETADDSKCSGVPVDGGVGPPPLDRQKSNRLLNVNHLALSIPSPLGLRLASTTTDEYTKTSTVPKSLTGRRNSLPFGLKFNIPVVHFRSTPNTPADQCDNPQVVSSRIPPLAEAVSIDSDEEFEGIEGADTQMIGKSPFPSPERVPLLSDTTSRTSMMTSQSSVVYPPAPWYGMENQAKLPKGIDNIRPHLKYVDNVPLLVPLFTDCKPEANAEMIKIMQENGEVVCCLGSTLTPENIKVFLQANASIGFEPQHPAICAFNPGIPKRTLKGPVALACLITSLPCCLNIAAGEHINLLQLISQSRRWLDQIRLSLLFYFKTTLGLTVFQMLAQPLLLPPPLDFGHLMWIVCFVLPILCAALCAKRIDLERDALEISIAKNNDLLPKRVVRNFMFAFCVKVLPTIFICLFVYKATLHHYCGVNRGSSCSIFETSFRVENTTVEDSVFLEKNNWSWQSARAIVSTLLVFYYTIMTIGFVYSRKSIWKRSPLSSRIWLSVCICLLFIQALYLFGELEVIKNDSNITYDHLCLPIFIILPALIWIIPMVLLIEMVKLREINIFSRNQRRRRLSFDTKLGMNSPF